MSLSIYLVRHKQMHSDDSYIIFNVMNWQNCHDLANWLSHYLYFFSFLFFSYLQLQECGKVSRDFVTMSQWCDGGSQWSQSQVTVTVVT